MRALTIVGLGEDRPLSVLCLGAHSDDIEIGAGATLLALLGQRSNVAVHWSVLSSSGDREREAETRRSAELFLEGATNAEIEVLGFRDGFFPYTGDQVKEWFEELKERVEPDLIFSHRRDDGHQDHRLVSELTWNTFRDHTILEYEIPKYDGELGQPNLFVPIDDESRVRKVEILMDVFGTQRSRRWFTPETFNGLMRLRGVECASPSGFAEAFHARKTVLDLRRSPVPGSGGRER